MPQTPSPLRYPGGKTKLFEYISPVVTKNLNGTNRIYIEPFAGGSGLALKLLFAGIVDSLILNDLDYSIYCFWNSCITQAPALCTMIEECTIDLSMWNTQKYIFLNQEKFSPLEIGFATFFLNRCNVSGVIKGGPIGGTSQKGKYKIDARFNKSKLISKIEDIYLVSDRIKFFNLDASEFLLNQLKNYNINNTLLNIDPPYVNKGACLYKNSFTELDHKNLSSVIKKLEHKWIVTYDENDFIDELYQGYRKEIFQINYSAGKTKTGREFIIYGDTINLSNIND